MKNHEQLNPYYPIFLNISGKRCVVVGGGQVAHRKIRTLLEHNADVQVISPDLCPELGQLAESGKIEVLHRDYRAGDLRKAFIAVAATNDSDINLEIVKEARKNAVLVNIVDDAENSDFILPSHIHRGDLTIAISTAGKSPALTRKIKNKLEEDFGDEYASLTLLINEVRTEIKRQGIKVSSDDWEEALDLDLLLNQVRSGNNEKAKAILLSNLERRRK